MRIVIAEDSALFRGLTRLLAEAGHEVVARLLVPAVLAYLSGL